MLRIAKGSRESQASLDVYVKSGAPPKVIINPIAAAKIDPTAILVLESLIEAKKTVNATWSCVQSDGSYIFTIFSQTLPRKRLVYFFSFR